ALGVIASMVLPAPSPSPKKVEHAALLEPPLLANAIVPAPAPAPAPAPVKIAAPEPVLREKLAKNEGDEKPHISFAPRPVDRDDGKDQKKSKDSKKSSKKSKSKSKSDGSKSRKK